MRVGPAPTILARMLRRRLSNGPDALLSTAAAAALLWGLPLVSAHAATITVRSHPEPVYGNEVVYLAAPGERNQVTLPAVRLDGSMGADAWEVHDDGAVISATGPCEAVDDHTARCRDTFTGDPIGGYRVRLGDGDDTLRVASQATSTFVARVVVDGGPGDDRLFGGDSEYVFGDHLSGGGGRDELHGGPGPDVLTDGDRSGTRSADLAPDRDVLDGGPGADTVSYQQRTRAVRVDLADPAGDGEPGERDALRSIESIVGGQASDRLAGDDGPNSIDGQRGRDRLIGRGGADELRSGATNTCGRGGDTVRTAGLFAFRDARFGLLAPDCERLDPQWSILLEAYPARVTPRAIVYRLECPFDEDEGEIVPCGGRLQVREHVRPHRLLAQGRLRRGEWAAGRLLAKLTALGRQRARAGQRLMVDMSFAEPRFSVTARWTISAAFGR
jgi:hypothetical protein